MYSTKNVLNQGHFGEQVALWLQTLNPFKYLVNNVNKYTIYNDFEQNLLFILYGLKCHNYQLFSNLTDIICTFVNNDKTDNNRITIVRYGLNL